MTNNGLFQGVDGYLIELVLGKKFLTMTSNELFEVLMVVLSS